MTNTLELRHLASAELHASGNSRMVQGYAAVFGQLSEPLSFGVEKIRQGAFSRSLREKADVRALVNHDANLILGRTTAGTLDLSEDTHGLHFRLDMPNNSLGLDMLESVRRGDISQCSFGFSNPKDTWEGRTRVLLDLDLVDVSLVTYPAYKGTRVDVRGAGEGNLTSGWYIGGRKITDTSHEVTSDELERLRLRLSLLKRL